MASGQLRIGRFGWKAQQATLLSFAGDAYLNEMSVTSRLFPTENGPNGNAALLARYDKVHDLEDSVDPATGQSDIDHAADFMRLRAPPPPVRAAAASLAGGKLFEHARCNACHQPVMLTGPSPVRALAYQPVRLFSNLLLHDMGALGDGIEQDSAEAREMRTAPLWGAAGPTGFSARWPCVVGGPGDPAARWRHRPLAEPLQGAQAGRATAIAGVFADAVRGRTVPGAGGDQRSQPDPLAVTGKRDIA